MNDNPKAVVTVIFVSAEAKGIPSGGKTYDYFVPAYMNYDLKPEDHVIVRGGNGELSITRIVEIRPAPVILPLVCGDRPMKAILGVADLSQHNREVERRARRIAVIEALTRLEERRTERARFAELAKGDNAAAALVAELEQLDQAAA